MSLSQSGLDSLKDKRAKSDVIRRLKRVEAGNFGDHHSLKGTDGVSELRITHGKGLRIYYGETEVSIVLLLCGGDKTTQLKDIETATKYWRNYLKSQIENPPEEKEVNNEQPTEANSNEGESETP